MAGVGPPRPGGMGLGGGGPAPPAPQTHAAAAAVAAALTALLLPLAALVGREVGEPYMDEPFHVPQARAFCAGRWGEWDGKITTFPGLYLAAVPYGRALHALGLAGADPCGLAALRSLNAALAVLGYGAVYGALAELHPRAPRRGLALQAGALALFPPHFFFAFLFYTDVGSLAATVGAYWLSLRGRPRAAGAAAAAAVLFRQTNAVWVAFGLCAAVYDLMRPEWRRGGAEGTEKGGEARGLVEDAVGVLRLAWAQKGRLAGRLWPLAAVVAGFMAFVAGNGGSIVVGDKAAHRPVPHLAQVPYFALFAAAALCPGPLLFRGRDLAARGWAAARRAGPARTALAVGAAAAAVAWAVRGFTFAHPYLLADNRHYTFYAWRRTLGGAHGPALRYLLVPAYLASGACLWALFTEGAPALLALAWALAAAATLVPAHLVEVRYFTPGFVLLCLHARPWRPAASACLAAAYLAVNLATLYVFLYRPFAWADGSTARFMW